MLLNLIRKLQLNKFSRKLGNATKVKYADYFDLKEHQNETTDTRFLYDLYITDKK